MNQLSAPSAGQCLSPAAHPATGSETSRGVLDFDDNDTGDADAGRLLRGNGLRDYSIWVGSLQGRFGKWTLGADALW